MAAPVERPVTRAGAFQGSVVLLGVFIAAFSTVVLGMDQYYDTDVFEEILRSMKLAGPDFDIPQYSFGVTDAAPATTTAAPAVVAAAPQPAAEGMISFDASKAIDGTVVQVPNADGTTSSYVKHKGAWWPADVGKDTVAITGASVANPPAGSVITSCGCAEVIEPPAPQPEAIDMNERPRAPKPEPVAVVAPPVEAADPVPTPVVPPPAPDPVPPPAAETCAADGTLFDGKENGVYQMDKQIEYRMPNGEIVMVDTNVVIAGSPEEAIEIGRAQARSSDAVVQMFYRDESGCLHYVGCFPPGDLPVGKVGTDIVWDPRVDDTNNNGTWDTDGDRKFEPGVDEGRRVTKDVAGAGMLEAEMRRQGMGGMTKIG